MTARRSELLLIGVLLSGCGGGDGGDEPDRSPEDRPADQPAQDDSVAADRATETTPDADPAAPGLFTDVTSQLGVDFTYETRSDRRYYLPGIMGGGGAIFDADGDGDLDLYLINGHDGTSHNALRNHLFLQDADGRFVDATARSNLGDRGDGTGCAVLDIDNDGDLDVYVTNVGPDRLFRNNGNAVFTDITPSAGIDNPGWGTSVVALDANRDGWLDLYVANYVRYDDSQSCVDDAGRPDYCGPSKYPAAADHFYLNRGDGTFVDAAATSGIGAVAYAGLGVVAADFDGDGWMDIYVANDKDPNLLWINRGDGTFTDDAIIAGAAYNSNGRTEAGMGVTAGDADGDGDLDLYMTHFMSETNTFYRSENGTFFLDESAASGLGAPTLPYTGWGTAFFDADLDGDLDVAVANGSVKRRAQALRTDLGALNDYAERDLLFLNTGSGRFERVLDDAFVTEATVTRGLMPADLDGDGDLDLVVVSVGTPARIYRNQTNHDHWLSISVIDPALQRTAIGAVVTIRSATTDWVRHAIPPGGYLTGGLATIHLGLPPETGSLTIDVRWPGGDSEQFVNIGRGAVKLIRGTGSPLP